MKASVIEKSHKTILQEDPNADTMIVVNDANNDITLSLSGDPNKIGQAMYAMIQDFKHKELAEQTFQIIKGVVYNVLKSSSPTANEMANVFKQASKLSKTQCKTVPFIPRGEA